MFLHLSPNLTYVPLNKFRNASNSRLTKGLFYETTLEDKASVVYTLKPEDHKGYPSLYRLYMDEEDITEFSFAEKYLDGYDHWEMLCSSTWFKPYLKKWRRDLELKLRSRSLKRIEAIASSEGKDSLSANKFLLTYKDTPSGKGRPSKEDIRRAAHDEFSSLNRVQEDYNRLLPETLQ